MITLEWKTISQISKFQQVYEKELATPNNVCQGYYLKNRQQTEIYVTYQLMTDFCRLKYQEPFLTRSPCCDVISNINNWVSPEPGHYLKVFILTIVPSGAITMYFKRQVTFFGVQGYK